MTAISKSLQGLFFSLGLFLIVVWNVAGNVFINPFHEKLWAWSAIGLMIGFILMINSVKLSIAKNIRNEMSKEVEEEDQGTFNIFHIIKQSDENISEVLGTFLIVITGIGLNYYIYSEGNWKFTSEVGYLLVGGVIPFFYWNFYKSSQLQKPIGKARKASAQAKTREGGSFIVDLKNDELTFTLPIIEIGKIKHARPTLKVSLSEIKDFRVFESTEEYQAFKERNIDGDLEFGIQSAISNVTFMTDPNTRPNCFYSDGSTGDFNIYVSGENFRWLIAIQPQHFDLLDSLYQDLKKAKKSVR